MAGLREAGGSLDLDSFVHPIYGLPKGGWEEQW